MPARNGLDVVDRYREQAFGLVLMGCQMPEMEGYEAARAILRIGAFRARGAPIIALTAHAMEGSPEASLASGSLNIVPDSIRESEKRRNLSGLVSLC